MNKRYETQIKLINNELKKLEPEKTDIFKKYINYILKKHSESVFISNSYNYRKIIANIDPSIKDEKYILENIIKYKSFAWSFYQFLYNHNLLSREYRFLKGTAIYNEINYIVKNNLSVNNFVCCKVHKSENRYIVNTSNRKVIAMIESFFDSRHSIDIDSRFVLYIADFLDAHKISCYEGITDDLIELCILKAYTNKIAHLCKRFLMFCILNSKNTAQLKKYSIPILSRQNFVNELNQGYRTVIYNKLDHIPAEDKWMLLPNGDELRSTQLTAETVISIDFSTISNNQLKSIAKEWFWYSDPSVLTKSRDLRKIIDFINMFFNKNEPVKEIGQVICANYKSFVISKWKITETRNSRMYPVLNFIKYIDNFTNIKIDKGCYKSDRSHVVL